jgi:hypothetical protein
VRCGSTADRGVRETRVVTLDVSREQVLRYRARASHLGQKLPAGAFAEAAWGGLQDSVPRAGVISLHARVKATRPDSWEDPSVVQIWFRGGTDYIVPREDVGIFTLGSYPRDAERAARLERLADDIHRVTEGRTTPVRDVAERVGHRSAADPLHPRASSTTGRVLIRWDTSNIWVIPVERPDMDAEDARRELARRFLHWYGPGTRQRLATWTGVPPGEVRPTWEAIESELAEVHVGGERRFMLTADVEALRGARPLRGVRLLPFDDPFTKLDPGLLVLDEKRRRKVLPRGYSRGFIPGTILVDGEIVGAWQRQQRKVTIHPFSRLPASTRETVEREALSFPIAGTSESSVTWA